MIIEVDIPQEWLDEAKSMAKEMGRLRNSIRSGEGNLVGFLGEVMLANQLTGSTHSNTYNYDLLVGEIRIDVKTKETTVTPEDHFFVTVADYNTKQECDYYYFTRVHQTTGWGWLLGGISKEQFYQKAVFYQKGEVDPTSTMGWKFKADCYNLPISELKQPASLCQK